MVLANTDIVYFVLAIVIGTLAAIVYSIRVLILLERRIARIDRHIEMMAEKIIVEERKIERVLTKKK